MSDARAEPVWAAWNKWETQLAGDAEEDLSTILTHVRRHKTEPTRRDWARDWRTRTFCDLGLHLLYQHHVNRSDGASLGEDTKLFRNLGPEDLQNHANEVIRDPNRAAKLDKDRWTATWSYQSAYTDDLIAYLFRPGPYVRRIREIQPYLAEMANTLPLGQLIRQGTEAELQSTLDDPLNGLQAFVQAALPSHPAIRTYVRRLDELSLNLWADLYASVFPTYGLTRRDGVQWRDIAELFTTAVEGTQLRVRAREGIPRVSNGDDVLASSLLAMSNSQDLWIAAIDLRAVRSRRNG